MPQHLNTEWLKNIHISTHTHWKNVYVNNFHIEPLGLPSRPLRKPFFFKDLSLYLRRSIIYVLPCLSFLSYFITIQLDFWLHSLLLIVSIDFDIRPRWFSNKFSRSLSFPSLFSRSSTHVRFMMRAGDPPHGMSQREHFFQNERPDLKLLCILNGIPDFSLIFMWRFSCLRVTQSVKVSLYVKYNVY